ncbi:MAG: hypothetical protein LCH54_00050 [Bacteroidetes bacterium]|nr:hypothetical protein [Bacteroidota bacterium]
MDTADQFTFNKLACLYLGGEAFYSNPSKPVLFTTTDFLKVKRNHWEEAVYYLEFNRVPVLDEAARQQLLGSYLLLSLPWDSGSRYDFILKTDFYSHDQFFSSEERLKKLTHELRPHGPDLLSGLKPDTFLELISTVTRYYI